MNVSFLSRIRRLNVRSISSSLWLLGPTKVSMPAYSPTMTEGTIVSWSKKEGEKISAGDVLCEVQTDKAVVALEAEEDAVVAKIIKAENSGTVGVGELIAILAGLDEDWRTVEVPPANSLVPSSGEAAGLSSKPAETSSPVMTSNQMRVGPAVKLLLMRHGLNAANVKASGPHHSLLKSDVLDHLKTGGDKIIQASFSAGGQSEAMKADQNNFVDLPLSSMRKTIGKRLSQSKSTIPHIYTAIRIQMDAVERARHQLSNFHNIKLSINDFFIRAAALALMKVPQVNSIVDEASGQLQVLSQADVSVAVATPNGLITPIVFNAANLSLAEINSEVRRLAGKAREGRLAPHEFLGGSFSISNLGMFGIRQFTAIINPPQTCILAVGAGQSEPFSPDGVSVRGRLATRVSLSSDSRFVDSRQAAMFLDVLRGLLERPFSAGGVLQGTPLESRLGDASQLWDDALVGDSVGLGRIGAAL